VAAQGWRLRAGGSGLAAQGWRHVGGGSGLAAQGWRLRAGGSGLAAQGWRHVAPSQSPAPLPAVLAATPAAPRGYSASTPER
jgi:hypothetical protein